MTKRLLTVLIAVAASLALLGSAQAASAPVEAYSSYQPQTKCSAWAKPGAKVLRRWVVCEVRRPPGPDRQLLRGAVGLGAQGGPGRRLDAERQVDH